MSEEYKPLEDKDYANNYHDLFLAGDVRSAVEGLYKEFLDYGFEESSYECFVLRKWFPVFFYDKEVCDE